MKIKRISGRNLLKQPVYFLVLSLFLYSCNPKGFTKLNQTEYQHKYSEVVFPEEIGPFKRSSLQAYDSKGENVSVGYNIRNPDCNITFTMYIYPKNNVSFRNEFDNVKRAITYYHKDAVKISEGNYVCRQDSLEVVGEMVTYNFKMQMDAGTELFEFSEAYLFDYGDRFVKYRITYTDNSEKCADEEIKKIISSLKWIRE